ncbi:hypothetical protein M758_3G203000 [Ceratodon purpureus]|nr:hypothetical protein M758_3G203000 [Ceratodon purpureus]
MHVTQYDAQPHSTMDNCNPLIDAVSKSPEKNCHQHPTGDAVITMNKRTCCRLQVNQ